MNKVLFFLICLLALLRVIFCFVNYDDSCIEYEKTVDGTITYFINDGDKTVIDLDRKYRITLYKSVTYDLGDKIRVNGIFKKPTNNTVFNLFNYKKYLLSKKIKLISINPKIKLIKRNSNIFYELKKLITKRIALCKTKSYLSAFIIGDTSLINENVKNSYRNIGISHLFSISGMHVGVFVFLINKLFKQSRFKGIIIFLFLLAFLFFTNFTESLLRCVTFIFLSWINKKFNLGYENILIIILVAAILILINPYLIYNVGFLFSVIITFFIILSSEILRKRIYISKIIIMSFVCFFASIPILSLSFFKVNLLTPIYNIVFVPIVSFLVFPFALIVFVFPFLDGIYEFLLNILECMILNLDKIKLFTFALSKPNLIIVLVYYVLLFLTIKKNRIYIYLFLSILILNINARFFIFTREVVFLDVGQGDSAIVIFPKGKTILIDTGGLYKDDGKIAKNKIIPYLNSRGISKIGFVILTHGDFDHMGEAINLVNNFKVEKVIFNCGKYNDLEQELIKVLDQKKIKYYSCIKELNIDKYKLQFLNTKEYDNENDNSNVIYFNYDGYKILFMGDAGKTREKDILDKYNLSDVDFLKVGHHGSNTSSSGYFIDRVNPKYSLISVGKNNRYGHPKDEVLDTLKNSKIYRTDIDGSIEIK